VDPSAMSLFFWGGFSTCGSSSFLKVFSVMEKVKAEPTCQSNSGKYVEKKSNKSKTYIFHFEVGNWMDLVYSSSWGSPPPPHSRVPVPRDLEVPTAAGASAARAPWLPWKIERRQRWIFFLKRPRHMLMPSPILHKLKRTSFNRHV